MNTRKNPKSFMKNRNTSITRTITFIIFTAMANPSFSQKYPAFDTFRTSAGEVEIHFVGHGSLMFRVNNYVIHVDPVKSSGSYEKMPKADVAILPSGGNIIAEVR